jgi:CRP-like cAMP-binding protein
MDGGTASILECVPLFAALHPPERLALARCLRPRSLLAGETLLSEGAPHGTMWILVGGRVAVAKKIGHEANAVVHHVDAPAHFGELEWVDAQPACATVVAETECDALVLEQRDLHALMERDSALFARVAWVLASELARRVRRTDAKVQEVICWGIDAAAMGDCGGFGE